ncbi:MAG TPA: Uma2 family endonuclease [Pyrinomonadaceae bacterium]|nr:Uma2 family endonuclease [Pyrinomonadaceae bacterium]
MSQVLTEPQVSQAYVTLRLHPAIELTDDEFFALCQLNRDLRFERTSQGDIIIMAPTGAETGIRNSSITGQLYNWAKRDGTGAVFDSSTGFKLPNGADRSPDASWIPRSRLATLTAEQKEKFLPLCPDFVIELLSPTDTLGVPQAKMDEYIENGAQLGWLIDPEVRQIHVYRPRQAVVILTDVVEIAADPELPGFVLDLREIWEPNV